MHECVQNTHCIHDGGQAVSENISHLYYCGNSTENIYPN